MPDGLCQHLKALLDQTLGQLVNHKLKEASMNIVSSMPNFLRDPHAFSEEHPGGRGVLTLGLASVLYFMAYGLTVGLSKSLPRAISAAVKLPVLFLVTMAFCLPALYFFSQTLLGTPLRMIRVMTDVLGGMGVTSFLLLGLAPITQFFGLTSENDPFFNSWRWPSPASTSGSGSTFCGAAWCLWKPPALTRSAGSASAS